MSAPRPALVTRLRRGVLGPAYTCGSHSVAFGAVRTCSSRRCPTLGRRPTRLGVAHPQHDTYNGSSDPQGRIQMSWNGHSDSLNEQRAMLEAAVQWDSALATAGASANGHLAVPSPEANGASHYANGISQGTSPSKMALAQLQLDELNGWRHVSGKVQAQAGEVTGPLRIVLPPGSASLAEPGLDVRVQQYTHYRLAPAARGLGVNGAAAAVNGSSANLASPSGVAVLEPPPLPLPAGDEGRAAHGAPHVNGVAVASTSLLPSSSLPPHEQRPAVDEAAERTSGVASSSGNSSSSSMMGSVDADSEDAQQQVPRPIWILCCISAALTCASCVFNTALPIYMVSELKMSMRSMGMFEGLLEAFSYVVRMCSGIVSDRMTSRKAAITLGFALGAAAKFGMASSTTVLQLFTGKAMDRLANGVQAAPRDALIGDLSPPRVRSACFGLAQSLRKYGSAVGALITFFLMKASNNNYQLIFSAAATVSLAATAAFVLLVPAHARSDAAPAKASAAAAAPLAAAAVPQAPKSGGLAELWQQVTSMGSDFYRMLGVICLYAMGHINESLLEARAIEVGFGKAEATLVVAALCVVTFLTAYPLGRLDDKYGPRVTFAVGVSALIAGDLVLMLSGTHPAAVFLSCAFLGVHWAVIQGPLLSVMAGLAPAHLRGTAFGIYYTVMALAAVGANTMYGTLWHTFGAQAAFGVSASIMSMVLLALPVMLPKQQQQQGQSSQAAPAVAPLVPQPLLPSGLTMPMPAAA